MSLWIHYAGPGELIWEGLGGGSAGWGWGWGRGLEEGVTDNTVTQPGLRRLSAGMVDGLMKLVVFQTQPIVLIMSEERT